MTSPNRTPLTRDQIIALDEWSVARGKYQGKPMVVRINTALKACVGHPEFKHRLGVAVPFLQPQEDGFPDSQESEQLNEIEDALTKAFESGRHSVLALVITCGGMREFVFYSADPQRAEQETAKVCQAARDRELQHQISPDGDWSVYRAFAGD